MSSSITLSSYKVFCVTENIDVYTYGYQEAPPTVCPHNNTHTINTSTIAVVNTYTIPGNFILTDTSGTNGNSVVYGLNSEFQGSSPGTLEESTINALPYNVKVSTITINPGPENYFDVVSIYMPHNVTIGSLASGVSPGSYTIAVDGPTYSSVNVGYLLKLTEGSTTEEFQTVIGKNSLTQELTLSSPTVNSYSAAAVVSMSIPRIVDLLLNSSSRITLGSRGFNPFLLSSGSAGIIRYLNNDGRYKQLNMVMEFYY